MPPAVPTRTRRAPIARALTRARRRPSQRTSNPEIRKMPLPRRRSAIKAGLSLALLLIVSAASAESIGTVTRLEGVLVASRADGSVKVLGVDSAIEAGDILSSRKQTYGAVTLADNSTVTLG